MVCEVNGSPGTQCSGVPSQEKDTLRALSGMWGVLDMASMY